MKSMNAFKGIGTVAIASFTFVATPFLDASAEAAYAQPQLDSILTPLQDQIVDKAET